MYLPALLLVLLWARMAFFCVTGLWACRRMRHTPLPPPIADSDVTVLVPAWNEAHHIDRTLAALLAQRPGPPRIVVIDDGSSDDTAARAEAALAGRPGCRVIRLAANGGKAAALNAGLRVADSAFVATVDADTCLAPDALQHALATLHAAHADAVAFTLDVANPERRLARLQRQEYLAGFNFERAGQDVLGAIAVLPGAATLFRREQLARLPFSVRTLTEDADHTLGLARRGARLVLAGNAHAHTVVPATWRTLLAQRRRWTAGHLQCLRRHAGRTEGGSSWRFRLVTLPNFLLATLLAPAGLLAQLALLAAGHDPALPFDGLQAMAVSVGLAYAQRMLASLAARRGIGAWADFLLEPLLSNTVATLAFGAALAELARRRGRP